MQKPFQRPQAPPKGPFDDPRELVGKVEKHVDRNGKDMLKIQIDGYDKAFFAFATAEKILPSGKKSFRATSYHIIEFIEGCEPRLCGAVWTRDSAQRQKDRQTNPDLPPDRMRIRLDGDLQNYMAYEAPDAVLIANEQLLGRLWKSQTATSKKPVIKIHLSGKRGISYQIWPKQNGPSTVTEIKKQDNDYLRTDAGTAVFTDGRLETVEISGKTYTLVETAGFIVLKTKARQPKTRDLEAAKSEPDKTPAPTRKPITL